MEGGRDCSRSLQSCSPAVITRYICGPTTVARLGLCRQSWHYFTFISSNWNDKYWDLQQLGPFTSACVNKSLSTWGDLMTFLQRRERTLAAIITTKNSSELLTQLFKISKGNPKQTNYRNLRRNYCRCPSGIIWKPKHLRLSNMTDILATSLLSFKYDFIQFCVDNTEVFQP